MLLTRPVEDELAQTKRLEANDRWHQGSNGKADPYPMRYLGRSISSKLGAPEDPGGDPQRPGNDDNVVDATYEVMDDDK